MSYSPARCIALFTLSVGLVAAVAAQSAPTASPPGVMNDDSTFQKVDLWPGPPPGSETWNWSEVQRNSARAGRFVHNVVKPMVMVMPADPAVANGTAVIVAPGGGFFQQSWDAEGVNIAKTLNAYGITAFILKYRLNQVFVDDKGEIPFSEGRPRLIQDLPPGAPGSQRGGARPLAIEDGRQAMRVIRSRAAEWKIDPQRIGYLGFSAGGMLGLDLTLDSPPEIRPNFVGIVYGTIGQYPPVPKDAPPLFLVATVPDVTTAGPGAARMAQAWMEAGRSVELHLYAKGEHAFAFVGNQPRTGPTLPAHSWMDRFRDWLDNEGLLKPAATP